VKELPVSPEVLENLIPLRDLDGEALRELASKTRVESQPAGRQMPVNGARERWIVYLLEGELELRQGEQVVTRLTGGSARAQLPLGHGRRHPLMAHTMSEVRFIRIDNDLLSVMIGSNSGESYQVEEITADQGLADQRLFNEIYHDYMADRLELPSIPDIALRVRRVVQDSRTNISAIARVIQLDPALTARLIQVANSPMYRGTGPISDCRGAVTRLGLDVTRNLVMSFSLRSLFRTKSRSLHRRMQALWLHSSRVAGLSYVLATRTPGIDPDRAMLAGLVHDIGVLPILGHVERFPELLGSERELERTVNTLRAQIGAMVLRKWQFSSDLVTVALEAEEWYRDPAPTADYCDVVLVGQLHSFVGTAAASHYPPMSEVPAFFKMARGRLDPEMSLQMLEKARDEMSEVLELLKG
jgi:HD-like signal output (HDOD) protein